MALADLMVVMDGGRIRQTGCPREVFERPASAFVARFIGGHNVLPWRDKTIAVRADHCVLGRNGATPGLPGRVSNVEYQGPSIRVALMTNDGIEAAAVLRDSVFNAAPGEPGRRGDALLARRQRASPAPSEPRDGNASAGLHAEGREVAQLRPRSDGWTSATGAAAMADTELHDLTLAEAAALIAGAQAVARGVHARPCWRAPMRSSRSSTPTSPAPARRRWRRTRGGSGDRARQLSRPAAWHPVRGQGHLRHRRRPDLRPLAHLHRSRAAARTRPRSPSCAPPARC